MKVNKKKKIYSLNEKIVERVEILSYYYYENESRTIEKCVDTQYNILVMRNKKELDEAIQRYENDKKGKTQINTDNLTEEQRNKIKEIDKEYNKKVREIIDNVPSRN